MSALIVGLGSIGRRHLENLRHLAPEIPVTIWHHGPRSGGGAPVCGERQVFSLDDALMAQPEFALITGPASLHVLTALPLAERGIHLFVEKPLSDRIEGVDLLLQRCADRRLVLTVGYNFRFYTPLRVMRTAVAEGRIGRILSVRAEVGQYLPDWRAGRDYRGTVSARSHLGGGALLELSHEIDYVRWMVGEVSTVTAQIARVSDLDLDVEDLAEILLGFENGAIGAIHMDMVQRAPSRSCRIIGSEGTLTWDGLTHQVRLYSAAAGAWTELHPPIAVDRNEMYVAELRQFLKCVRGDGTAAVSGEDGRRVLEIVLAARHSSAERRAVAL